MKRSCRGLLAMGVATAVLALAVEAFAADAVPFMGSDLPTGEEVRTVCNFAYPVFSSGTTSIPSGGALAVGPTIDGTTLQAFFIFSGPSQVNIQDRSLAQAEDSNQQLDLVGAGDLQGLLGLGSLPPFGGGFEAIAFKLKNNIVVYCPFTNATDVLIDVAQAAANNPVQKAATYWLDGACPASQPSVVNTCNDVNAASRIVDRFDFDKIGGLEAPLGCGCPPVATIRCTTDGDPDSIQCFEPGDVFVNATQNAPITISGSPDETFSCSSNTGGTLQKTSCLLSFPSF